MATTEGFTFLATSTKPLLQSFAVVFSEAARLQTGSTRIRNIQESKKHILREKSLFFIRPTSIFPTAFLSAGSRSNTKITKKLREINGLNPVFCARKDIKF
jgi:hypothetical protein